MARSTPATLLAAALLLAAASAGAHPGTGIVVDARGRVVFTNLKSVWRWEPGGRVTEIVPGVHTHALRLEEDGTLVGEDLHYDAARARFVTALWRLSPEGLLSRGRATDESPFEFSDAVGADGSIYFSRVDNNRRDVSQIYRQKPGGARELVAGGAYGYADGVGTAARFGPVGARHRASLSGTGPSTSWNAPRSYRSASASGSSPTRARSRPSPSCGSERRMA